MSDVKYRVTFTAGGHYEDRDLDAVKAMRDSANGGGVITAIDMIHTVSNDPELRVFPSADAAEEVVQQLRSETFQYQMLEVLLDPQPEGLN